METQQTRIPQPPSRRGPAGMLGGFAILAVLFAAGLVPKLRADSQLKQEAKETGTEAKAVQVEKPRLGADEALEVPGSIQAIAETSVQARTSGYISKLLVDIGSKVKQGDLLAVIESPDVDQQFAQANADTAKSQASVGQSVADVARLSATVAQTRADVARQSANINQARAAAASARSKIAQAQASLEGAQAKLLQTRQQVQVQEANLAQAQAQLDLAVATEKRYRSLLGEGFVSQQDYDQAAASLRTTTATVNAVRANVLSSQADVKAAEGNVQAARALVESARADASAAAETVKSAQASYTASLATIDAAKASVEASRANVAASRAQVGSSQASAGRYAVLRSFLEVRAPFDGVITSRNVDIGSLVTPGATESSTASTTHPTGLFGLARVDTLRIRVNLPQTYYQTARAGADAQVFVRELPNRVFKAKIYQVAGALDSTTRTLQTEIRIPNLDNSLLPGMFATVKIVPAAAQSTLRIPANTLMFDSQGTRVAVVDATNHLHIRPVMLGRDFGKELEVLSGIQPDDRLVSNPTDDLQEGDAVQIGGK